MSKMKKSLSAMLLTSFLISPVYGGEKSVQERQNRFQRNVLNSDVNPSFDKRSQSYPPENKSSTLGKAAKFLLFGALGAAAYGGKKCYDYLNEDNSELNTSYDSIVNESYTTGKKVRSISCRSNNAMDEIRNIEFARFIGLDNCDIIDLRNNNFNILIPQYKVWVYEDFEKLIEPFIDLGAVPMSDKLKNELVNEMAITMFILDFSKYKTHEYYNEFVFPFTLLRIYGLTNVFQAMKDYYYKNFKITANWGNKKTFYYYNDKDESYTPRKRQLVEVFLGDEELLKGSGVDLKDCASGAPQFKDKNLVFVPYYILLGEIWKNMGKTSRDPNDSEPCRFYQAANLDVGEFSFSRLFTKSPLTLPLLKHVGKFEIEFEENAFKVKVEKGYTYIKLL